MSAVAPISSPGSCDNCDDCNSCNSCNGMVVIVVIVVMKCEEIINTDINYDTRTSSTRKSSVSATSHSGSRRVSPLSALGVLGGDHLQGDIGG